MDFNYQSVQRLGFDSYCSNLIVNLIEDNKLTDGFKFENETYSVCVKSVGKNKSVFIKAYVNGLGWQSTELVF